MPRRINIPRKVKYETVPVNRTTSRFTAAPSPFMESTNSAASFSLMLLPLRLRP